MTLRQIGADTREDMIHVCDNMRAMDALEITSTTHCKNSHEYVDFLLSMRLVGGVGWVAYCNDAPTALIGIVPMWSGVVQVWMFATDDFPKIGLPLTKFVKRNMIPTFVKQAHIHRAQCFSMDGHTVAHKWLQVLGARSEGVASGYGSNGEDFTLFSWRF